MTASFPLPDVLPTLQFIQHLALAHLYSPKLWYYWYNQSTNSGVHFKCVVETTTETPPEAVTTSTIAYTSIGITTSTTTGKFESIQASYA